MNKFWLVTIFCFAFLFGFSQKAKKLGLVFQETTVNFGDVEQWENQAAVFVFTNKSKHPVTILPIFAENDLEIIYPDKVIKPNETVNIEAIYYTPGTGNFTRKFPIYFSTLPDPIELKITGNIKSLSASAYIQCPMSKPMHSKSKTEIVGNVAEIDVDIPISGAAVTFVSLTDRSKSTLFTDRKGDFGAKLPIGNYEIIVEHPNYTPHQSFIYIGPTTGNVRIKLIPIQEVPFIANNAVPSESKAPSNPTPKPKLEEDWTNSKSSTPENRNPGKIDNNLEKVAEPKVPYEPAVNEPIEEEKLAYNPANMFGNDIPSSEPEMNKVVVEEPVYAPKESEPTPSEPVKDRFYSNDPTPTNNSYERTPINEPEIVEAPTEPWAPKDYSSYSSDQYNTAKDGYYEPPKDYSYTTPEITNQYEPYRPAPTDEVTIPTITSDPLYSFKVLDEVSNEPIGEASLFIVDFGKKYKATKGTTADDGFYETKLPKDNYRIIASADGYISNEVRLEIGEDGDINRIYLSPVSNLFESLLESKMAKNDDEEVLNQFSFGKSTFTFARDETEVQEPIVSREDVLAANPPSQTPIIVEASAPLVNDEKNQQFLDSLNAIVAQLQASNAAMKADLAKVNEQINTPEPPKNTAKEDSMKLLIESLIADQQSNIADLEKANDKAAAQAEELARKEAELNAQLAAIAEKEAALEEQEEALLAKVEEQSLEAKESDVASPELSKEEYAANNILFLIDISSSMDDDRKMELLKSSMKSLTTVLRDIDRVAIVAYNQRSNIVLESVLGDDKTTITQAIDSLKTSGLTYGVNGIQTAYEMLEYYYIGDGNNQIILATDGLFSKVNATMTENQLNKLVRQQANDNNIQLSVVGFGDDEEADKLMEKLASSGDGQFIKIRNPWEANSVLIDEIKLNSRKY